MGWERDSGGVGGGIRESLVQNVKSVIVPAASVVMIIPSEMEEEHALPEVPLFIDCFL